MPLLRFHMLTIDHEIVEGGFIVTITTNVACHVYLRHSDVFPRIHRKSTLRRGLVIGWDARYCFVAYHHIEQNEPGDTFTHTFTWPGWENCNTMYFYFWGSMSGLEMVSDTPIFWMHYLWVAPPELLLQEHHVHPLEAIYGLTADGRLAQSFTPQSDYSVIKVAVPMRGTAGPDGGIWHVQIRTNNVGQPSEEVLWEGTLNVAAFPSPGYQWFGLDVAGVDAQNGIPLWIVGFRTDYTWWWDYPYQMGDTGNLYTRGEALFQSAPGDSWSGHLEGHDLGFKVFSPR